MIEIEVEAKFLLMMPLTGGCIYGEFSTELITSVFSITLSDTSVILSEPEFSRAKGS